LGEHGQLGTGDTESRLTPVEIQTYLSTPIEEISAGCFHSVFLSKAKRVYVCGSGENGQLGTGDERDQLSMVEVVIPNLDHDSVKFYVQASSSPARLELDYGSVPASIDVPVTSDPLEVKITPDYLTVSKIVTGPFQTFFLAYSGAVYACGLGEYGQLGTGDYEDRLTPVKIQFPPAAPVKQISTAFHTMFLLETGEIYACGGGEHGKLGTRDEMTLLTPTKVFLDF
jgi:alpha-tubulin suppressor-like RCC1 family protein